MAEWPATSALERNRSWRICRGSTLLFGVYGFGLFSPCVHAQTRAQVDLAVSVSMTPSTFVPNGHGTFTITVHNAGPDTAGTVFPDEKPIRALGSAFYVTTGPPPFDLVGITEGDCWLDRFVSEPLPDGRIFVAYDYYFGPIPAGESHSCTSDIYFDVSTTSNVPASWNVTPFNDDDINPANNRVDYVFRVRPVTISALSPIALLMLAFGLLLGVGFMRRRT
jgi:hypothetical protein